MKKKLRHKENKDQKEKIKQRQGKKRLSRKERLKHMKRKINRKLMTRTRVKGIEKMPPLPPTPLLRHQEAVKCGEPRIAGVMA